MGHVGEKIKKIRKEKKLTLADLAQGRMSAAMVSLIENGKSKPSAENLEHIANVLQVDISDLLGGKTREELKTEIRKLMDILNNGTEAAFREVIKRTEELIPSLGQNVESARIYEMHAKNLFNYRQMYRKQFDTLDDKDWVKFLYKAREIYSDFQLEHKIFTIDYLLVLTEYNNGNFQKAIDRVDEKLKQDHVEDSLDVISDKISLMGIKIACLEALGETDKAMELLEEVIAYANKHLMLNRMFELYNIGAMMSYNINEYEQARSFIDKMDKFMEIVNNKHLFIEKELITIHYTEFFEDQPEQALKLIEEFKLHFQQMSLDSDHWLSQGILEMVSDFEARCYTKIGKVKEALLKFQTLIQEPNEKVHPMDIALREINKSYQALCYMHLNNQKKAIQYAKEAVNKLQRNPHTAYYHFARNVLMDVQKNSN